MSGAPARLDAAAEDLLRELAPRVLGATVRRCGDFAAAEDAVQEALLAAALQWPRQGMPENPFGWLLQVAARRLTDEVRGAAARRRREAVVLGREMAAAGVAGTGGGAGRARAAGAASAVSAVSAAGPAGDEEQDDSLVLLFLCCHPALTVPSAIALTLRAVGGLTTAEIAKAYLVPEATMAQRISRAKQRIKASGVPFRMPAEGERAARTAAVLHVLYLIFNEGYASSTGADLQRGDLAREAIRLARAMHRLLPRDTEAAGLLALMLLTDARRRARSGPDGALIPLAEQDRGLWDAGAIEEGVALLTATLARGAVGVYQLQAAVAAVHDEARRAEDTDWAQILALYGLLRRMSDNPMAALSEAVAAAMVKGPRVGLEKVAELEGDGRLAGSHRVAAVRGHLLEMAGERDAAVAAYREAAGRTASVPERDYLLGRAARLNDGAG